ncbi:S8 family serine peptidase [Kineococcus terrestris]|uniref:S8 family serine peptidase n=1 Tax=Kineococcus terrestris TaxID=2044856 RepID=UPI0034DB528D
MGVVWTGKGRATAVVAGIAVAVTPALAAPAQAGTTAASVRSYDATTDAGSLRTIAAAVGATDVHAQRDAAGRALTGEGVTVAVLDSGVAPAPGLDAPGKLVQGPDLSLEADLPVDLGPDTFGHGTHLAGIVAADATGSDDPDAAEGIAPGAQVLGLKLGDSAGSTDVSQVVAALDWVVQHRADGDLDVRVVNLSYGTDSLQPYEVDPLAAAAENAWRHGIVVVASAGNGGTEPGRLTNPAIDPYVIAVGATDAGGDVDGWDEPAVASFSQRGTAERHVDLVAPGRSVTSLRVPGSTVDREHPEGLVDGDETGALFRGSGTSQAAAVVSGAAALLLQADPTLTPDEVKAALVSTADPLPGTDRVDQGAGQLDVAAALDALPAVKAADVAQRFPEATGTGSLDAARGTSRLVDPLNGDVLAGEVDVHGSPFDAAAWATASRAGTAWDGGTWNGAQWTGNGWAAAPERADWSTSRWSTSRWSTSRWSTSRWSTSRWSTSRWSTSRWSTSRWSTSRWSTSRWSVDDWATSRWSTSRWSTSRWSTSRWSTSRWSTSRWSTSRWSTSRWSVDDWATSRWSTSRWSTSRWSTSRWSTSRWS